MRSIKELLEVMLDNKDLFRLGLCQWNSSLYARDIITLDEHILLNNYIRSNRPPFYDNFTIFNHIIRRDDPAYHYYWKGGEIEPRIEWIQKHIAKNS